MLYYGLNFSRNYQLCVTIVIFFVLSRVKCTPTNSCAKDQKDIPGDEIFGTLEGCSTSVSYLNLTNFEFEPRFVPYNDSACLAFRMFEDMAIIEQLNIPVHSLSRFILKAQEGYNNIPYHNWFHGFSVLHFTYAVLKNCQIIKRHHLNALEGLALMTAAMCHDIDHRGLDNHFHNLTNSSLARTYTSGAIMERHHINVTLNILRSQETNFISNLKEEDARCFRTIIEKAILATNLPLQLKRMDELRELAVRGFDSRKQRDKDLLITLIISSGDLSDPTKSWTSVRQVARELFDEFFSQGDQEKRLGLVPRKLMDRDKLDIPSSQVQFISGTIIPVFRVLHELYNETYPSLHRLENNLANWKTSI